MMEMSLTVFEAMVESNNNRCAVKEISLRTHVFRGGAIIGVEIGSCPAKYGIIKRYEIGRNQPFG